MIEPYHYAGFSVQTAMAKEQRDRDAADELIRLRKTPKYCCAERTSFRRMTKIEDCLTKDSQFENHRRLCQRSASRQRPLAIRSRFMSRARVEAENLLLRQQLIVLRRKSPTRVGLWNIDRLLLVWLYRLYPSLLDAIIIVQPETVLHWHRRGFRAYWPWKSRSR